MERQSPVSPEKFLSFFDYFFGSSFGCDSVDFRLKTVKGNRPKQLKMISIWVWPPDFEKLLTFWFIPK